MDPVCCPEDRDRSNAQDVVRRRPGVLCCLQLRLVAVETESLVCDVDQRRLCLRHVMHLTSSLPTELLQPFLVLAARGYLVSCPTAGRRRRPPHPRNVPRLRRHVQQVCRRDFHAKNGVVDATEETLHRPTNLPDRRRFRLDS